MFHSLTYEYVLRTSIFEPRRLFGKSAIDGVFLPPSPFLLRICSLTLYTNTTFVFSS